MLFIQYIMQNTKAFAPQKPVGFHLSRNLSSQKFRTSTSLSSMPICIVVEAGKSALVSFYMYMQPLYIVCTNIPFNLLSFIVINSDNAHLPEIKEDRMEDFLDMIEKNAVGSRAEPGCLRFDVLQSADADNKFIFYEVYEGMLYLF